MKQHVERDPTAGYCAGMQAGGQNSNPQVKQVLQNAPKAGYWMEMQVVETVTQDEQQVQRAPTCYWA